MRIRLPESIALNRSSEKRGSPRAEGDRVRCDALLASGVVE